MNIVEEEKGIYLVFLAILLVATFFTIGLMFDSGKLYISSIRVQRAADVGALVGASHIGGQLMSQPTQINSCNNANCEPGVAGAPCGVADGDCALEAIAKRVARDNYDRMGIFYDVPRIDEFIQTGVSLDPATSNTLVTVSTDTDTRSDVIGGMLNGQEFYQPAGRAIGTRRPAAIALVVDVTGSMRDVTNGRTKLEHLKIAAQQFVDKFDKTRDTISLVKYSQANHGDPSAAVTYDSGTNWAATYWMHKDFVAGVKNYEPGVVGDASLGELKDEIEALTHGGYTDIHAGLYGGIQQLDQLSLKFTPAEVDAFLKVIVLITDGAANRVEEQFPPPADPSTITPDDVESSLVPTTCPEGIHHADDVAACQTCAPTNSCGDKNDAACGQHLREEAALRTVRLADYARRKGYYVYTLGVGVSAGTSTSFYQSDSDTSPSDRQLRPYFLRRVANDPTFPLDTFGAPIVDAALNTQCASSYNDIDDSPTGVFLVANDGARVGYLLDQVAHKIRLRLVQ